MRSFVFTLLAILLPVASMAQQDDIYLRNRTETKPKPADAARPQGAMTMTGQTKTKGIQDTAYVFFKPVSSRLHLKDKIIVVNKTSHTIVQMAIAVVNDQREYQALGSLTDLQPGKTVEFMSFPDNELRKLRGKILAIKVKGRLLSDTQSGGSRTRPTVDYTYDFDALLYERKHDLYIEVVTRHDSIMDF